MAFSTKLFSLDVPDEWHEQGRAHLRQSLWQRQRAYGEHRQPGIFPADPAAVQDYADEQVHHLQHDLRDCRIINRLVYNYGDKPVPISEYSWRNGESEVFQCQAFRCRRPHLDVHLHLERGRLCRGAGQHPDLISRFSPADEQAYIRALPQDGGCPPARSPPDQRTFRWSAPFASRRRGPVSRTVACRLGDGRRAVPLQSTDRDSGRPSAHQAR